MQTDLSLNTVTRLVTEEGNILRYRVWHGEKGSVKCWWKKLMDVCAYKEQYPDASQKILPAISPICGVKSAITLCCVGYILSEENK
jgi:hypothetical protein